MKLSIVTTLYRSAPYIEEFHRRAGAAARQVAGDDYEIVMVNDGSPDHSLETALRLVEADPRLMVIDLSRNFGHHKAVMTGLSHCAGDLIYFLDVDLEEEPEWLEPFHRRMLAEGCDVVYGVQETRKGGWFERWSGYWFYCFFYIITGLRIPKNAVSARLMTRGYVEALLGHRERELFLAAIMHVTGFAQCPYTVKKHHSSPTTYSLRKKLSLLVTAVTSFSNVPLKAIFYCGSLISAGAMLYIAYLVLNRWLWSSPLGGWTSLMSSIWLLGGLNIMFIGVVGIYLAKMFSEVKQRPYTIVRRIYRSRAGKGQVLNSEK